MDEELVGHDACMDIIDNAQATQKLGDWTKNADAIMGTGKSGDGSADARRVKKRDFTHTEFEFLEWPNHRDLQVMA